ncbi:uncharacterized protein LOC129766126 [Toxorhynchites rutilus septentrionalis]|uniref:uncharacterized protein LOC129766126 n=1 Tax=Toxorhynchites rutilus septentrionalis TaxID=329112 RepID=UPI002479272B|nr:uncharacterized protein LOC129766126 [Toxorhynchites rutilus septentrionalis]
MYTNSALSRVTRVFILTLVLDTLQSLSLLVRDDELQCTGGVCVPNFLCLNGAINVNGEGLIDLRSGSVECPVDMVCCKEPKQSDIIESPVCQGICVPTQSCSNGIINTTGKDLIDLRYNSDGCEEGSICCQFEEEGEQTSTICGGRCVSISECPNGSRNSSTSNVACPDDLICCDDSEFIQLLSTSDVCHCVPLHQCLDDTIHTGTAEMIDLRFSDKNCPANEICCLNIRPSEPDSASKNNCKGTCVPFSQCIMDSAYENSTEKIDLRLSDDCPNETVCCEHVSSIDVQIPNVCQGTCIPYEQCELTISSEESKACGNGLVCCTQPPIIESQSDCQCIPVGQCSDPTKSTADASLVDLRLGDSGQECLPGQMCCKTPISSNRTEIYCSGQCVPVQHCKNTGEHLFDLRGTQGCIDNFICCSEPIIEIPSMELEPPANGVCDGSCVPVASCVDSVQSDSIDLRTTDACGADLICCQNVERTPDKPGTPLDNLVCNGTCVLYNQCSDVNAVDLRLSANACSQGQICCQRPSTQPEEWVTIDTPDALFNNQDCNGTCIPYNQCSDVNAIDLRLSANACPPNLICCRGTLTETEVLDEPEIPSDSQDCNGTCVPYNQCSDVDAIDLRLSANYCSQGHICCQRPSTQPEVLVTTAEPEAPFNDRVCSGSCVPYNQCSDVNAIDLRLSINACPSNQICCRRTFTETEVLIPLDKPEIPSNNQACNGTCVPYNQCSDNAIDLRISANPCLLDQICCRRTFTETEVMLSVDKLGTPSNNRVCNGTCVPYNQCSDVNAIDLRLSANACPSDQICCQTPVALPEVLSKPKTCSGVCIPAQHCRDSSSDVDLRFEKTDDGCSGNLICCMTPPKMSPAEVMWTQWITDINNMIDHGSGIQDSKCSLKINRDSPYVSREEIPWLVTVWSKQNEYRCVGSQIGADAVLVPADCVADSSSSQLYVRSGDYELNSSHNRHEHRITKTIIHPNYVIGHNYANIALLFLAEKIGKGHPAACLLEFSEKLNYRDCYLVGWNSWDLGSDVTNYPTLPRKHHLTSVSYANCPLDFLCTMKNESAANCGNLRGSPLLCRNQIERLWKLAGLAMANNDLCDYNAIPESMLKISSYQPWIKEQLSPSFVQKPAALDPTRWYLPIV